MLFLTYHRVNRGGRDFYAITPEELNEHLGLLHKSSLHPGRAEDLALGKIDRDAWFLSFDDGTADHFDVVFPILRSAGARGIFFVPTAKLNKDGYLSGEQVGELARAGHVIGCHSHEHRRMDTLAPGEASRQLQVSMDILGTLAGSAPFCFAPPGGYFNSTVLAAAAAAGLPVVRTMKWGLNRETVPGLLDCVPVNAGLTSRRFSKILRSEDIAWLKLLYLGKEAAKRALPLRAYERIRARLSGRS